jgi:hypothetical protein
MRTEDTQIPLIALVVLMLSAFVPVLQTIMLHVIAIYLYPFEKIFGTSDIEVLNYTILIGGVFSIIGYYFSERTVTKVLWTVLTVFFLTAFIAFLTEDIVYDSCPYFLPFIISGVIVTMPLIFVGLVKELHVKRKLAK